MAAHKILLIGAGDMAGNHIRAWHEIGCGVEAIVDIDTERAHNLAAKWEIAQEYADYQEALEKSRSADIVDICIPLRWHAPVTIAAAEHGKHVLCEKPIARNLEEVDQMEAAIARYGVKFAVGQQRNLSPGVGMLRDLVQSGQLGRPLMFHSDGLAEVRPKRFMHDADNNNGPIVDTCVHNFLLWETVLNAKPVQIYAQGGILAHSHPDLAQFEHRAVDTGAIVVTYDSGDTGVMTISWGMPSHTKMKGHSERLIGSKGGVDAGATGELTPIYSSEETAFQLYLGDTVEEIRVGAANTFALQAQAFVDYVDGLCAAPPSGLETGRHLLRMSLAALQSIASGQPVKL